MRPEKYPIVDGMKLCGHCSIKKPISEFHKSSRNKSGLANECRDCSALLMKARYERCSDRWNETRKAKYAQNEEIGSRARAYQQAYRKTAVGHANRMRSQKEGRMRLANWAVKYELTRNTSINPADIPPALIELQKQYRRVKRLLKEIKDEKHCPTI